MTLELFKEAVLFILPPIGRSIVGWVKNSLEDNKITLFEWRKLIETIVRVGIQGLMIYVGLNEMGFEISALAASCAGYISDMVIRAIKGF